MKVCLENGLRVTCFDKSSKYGGLWNYRPDGQDLEGTFEPSVMRTTILNTSKELSSFSDFPPPAHLPNFMRHTHYMDYINSYVEHFELAAHLRLDHEILKCWPVVHPSSNSESAPEQQEQIKWLVRVKYLKSQEIHTHEFDRLMVAVGHHNIPYAPKYKHQEHFKGLVLHSAHLKDILANEKLRDKRVLIVGFGNSACDAANDIAMIASKCFVSCHRGQWFTSRYLHDTPYDFKVKTRTYYYASRLLPTSLMDRMLISRVERRVNHELLGLKPKHKPSEQVPAINDLFPYRIYTGGIILKSSIKTFTETGVKFEGEDEQEAHQIDVVVLATGYEAKIGFLDELQLGIRSLEHNNEYDLFLNVFAPKLALSQGAFQDDQQETNNNANVCHISDNKQELNKQLTGEHKSTPSSAIKSLAFIGLVQPNGSMTVIAELQARYAALVFSGQLELPSEKRMLKHMEQTRRMRSHAIRSHSRDQLIGNYVAYMETISSLAGVRPNLAKLFFKDHSLWRELMFGPCVPYQYRLEGPGYWPDARTAVMTTRDRVYQGINEGKNHILYKSRRKCLAGDGSSGKTKR